MRASVHADLHVQMRLHAAAPQRWIARNELLLRVDERADQTQPDPIGAPLPAVVVALCHGGLDCDVTVPSEHIRAATDWGCPSGTEVTRSHC